jgi:hypothetical protein
MALWKKACIIKFYLPLVASIVLQAWVSFQ